MLVLTSDTNMAASIAEVTSLEPMNRPRIHTLTGNKALREVYFCRSHHPDSLNKKPIGFSILF